MAKKKQKGGGGSAASAAGGGTSKRKYSWEEEASAAAGASSRPGLLKTAAAGAALAVAAYVAGRSSGGVGSGVVPDSMANRAEGATAASESHRRDSDAKKTTDSSGSPIPGLFEDVTALRVRLEGEAWERIRRHGSFLEAGEFDEAEANLRVAMDTCPWLPAPFAILANHITEYGTQRRVGELFGLLRRAMRLQHALPKAEPGLTPADLLASLQKSPSFDKPFDGTMFPARLRHDRDQLALLGERGIVPRELAERYVAGYEQLLAGVPEEHVSSAVQFPEETWAEMVGGVFNRALHVPDISPLVGPALNPALDFAALEDRYLRSDPHFVTFDNLLTDEALLKLRKYYEEATIFWKDYSGYVGSHMFDGGFGNAVIAQLAEELMDAFPRLICSHRLTQAWAFKYDSEIARPVHPHADMAAVNFNFWISPDDGNLDKKGGGLVVYTVVPPEDMSFRAFNHYPLHPEAQRMLEDTDFKNHTVPHKSNRAVVFQSDLFHESGRMRWALGYTKRRINITLLFGKMRETCTN